MGTPLDDAALVHDHDAVCVADGGQTVGDNKSSTSTHEGVHAILHQLLSAGIDGRGGLIQDEHRRVGHSSPGNGNELPLTLGQVGSVPGEHGVVSVRQAADKAVCVGQLGRRLTLLVGGLQVAVADVFQYRAGKQVGILEDDAQGAAQVRLFDLIDIDTVIADFAVGDVVETVYEVGDGGLACTGGTDKGDLLSRFGPQADVVENQLVFVVAEVHTIKDHTALQASVCDGTVRLVGMLPGPHIGALSALRELSVGVLFRVDQLHIALVLLRLLIHEIKDTGGTGGGSDHEVDLHAHLGDGLGKALIQAYKDDNRAQGNPSQAVDAQNSAYNGYQSIAQPADVAVDRHEQVGIAVGLVRALPQCLVHLVKIFLGGLLVAEYLDHLLSVQHLLDKAVHNAQIFLLLDIVFAGQLGEVGGHSDHDQSGQDRNNGEGGIQAQHDHQSSQHGNNRVDHLGNALAHQLTQGIDVVGVHRHDVAVGMGIKVFDGQGLHAVKQVVTQAAHGALTDGNHDAVIAIGGYYAQCQQAAQPNHRLPQPAEVGRTAVEHGDDVVVDQSLREAGTAYIGRGRDQDTQNHQQKLKFIVAEHIPQHPVEHLGWVAPFHVRIHSKVSSFHAGWSKSPPPWT